MVQEVTAGWSGVFNPLDDSLWMGRSDCDWVKSTDFQYMSEAWQVKAVGERFPWVVTDVSKAKEMIKENRQAVLSIIGALMSWRNCTISQLASGLSTYPMPEFDRMKPNLYGAMCRMGILNVGFSRRERFESVFLPQVWLGLTGGKSKVAQITKKVAGFGYPVDAIIRYNPGTHQYARHNTCATHVGLAFAHDPRIKYTAGDGWSLFRMIDAQAVGEMGGHFNNVPDVLGFTHQGVTAAIEVQSALTDVEKKMRAWVDFLSHSPMSRRGLVCIWLVIPKPDGSVSDFSQLIERASSMEGVTVGIPSVSERMGIAKWSDWFNPDGTPTEHLGEYTDLLGTNHSIYANEWGSLPTTASLKRLSNWGWDVMNRQILNVFGWDTSTWVKPELYRGDSYGFIGGQSQLSTVRGEE